MKTGFNYAFILSFTLGLAACGDNEQQSASVIDPLYEQQTAQYQQQLDVVDKQLKHTERQLQITDEQAERYEALLDRWERQADRMDNVLSAMEARYTTSKAVGPSLNAEVAKAKAMTDAPVKLATYKMKEMVEAAERAAPTAQ